jgi:hypothetical protein
MTLRFVESMFPIMAARYFLEPVSLIMLLGVSIFDYGAELLYGVCVPDYDCLTLSGACVFAYVAYLLCRACDPDYICEVFYGACGPNYGSQLLYVVSVRGCRILHWASDSRVLKKPVSPWNILCCSVHGSCMFVCFWYRRDGCVVRRCRAEQTQRITRRSVPLWTDGFVGYLETLSKHTGYMACV